MGAVLFYVFLGVTIISILMVSIFSVQKALKAKLQNQYVEYMKPPRLDNSDYPEDIVLQNFKAIDL